MNLRETKQRNLILEIINNSCEHLSAFQVYSIAKEKMPNISLGTVYRNLNLLFENCEIRKIHSNDNVEHFDSVEKEHNHFICLKCNKIYDVFENQEVNELDCGIVMNYEKVYKGICNKCIKTNYI